MGNMFSKNNNVYVLDWECNYSNLEIYYHLENKIKNTSNIVRFPSTIPNTTYICVDHPNLSKTQIEDLTHMRDNIIKRLEEMRGWVSNPLEIDWKKEKKEYTDIDGSTGGLNDVIIEAAF
tara:strand:+ start:76 stop:435 length:360 start_codon:yes stop_codon:yes gene_type:complete